jgi:hypothetical protein
MANTLSIKIYTASHKKTTNQTQENAVSHEHWSRKRRDMPPSLMTIPGELRSRIYDFVFEIAHQPDENPTVPSNNHLTKQFNLLLVSRQLRQELFEKIFDVDRFFKDFEALETWISRGTVVNPEILPRIRHVGIQMGRSKRQSDCNATYDDFQIQKALLRLPGLRTLHISSTYTLRSFVMNNDEITEIMTSICKVCPSLERLAFLAPSENLNFLYGLPNLRFLAITTPSFFDAEHFISVMRSLPRLEGIRLRDKSCSSAFTPFILSQIPALKEIQLKDDTTSGRVVVPEMMDALVRRHGTSVISLHLEASRWDKEGTFNTILSTLPKLQNLSTLKLWFDPDRGEEESLEALMTNLPLLRKLTDLHLCFRCPKSSCPGQVWDRIMHTLKAGETGMKNGEYWLNEEGYVLDDGHSGWVRDGSAIRQDEYYGTVWPTNRRFGWSGKGRYEGCMQVRVWK